MTKTYELICIAKEKLGIESDYGIARALGLSIQNVSDYKNKPNEAKGVKLLQIIVGAGMTADEALKFMTDAPMKQAGYANVYLLSSLAANSAAGIALSNVQLSPESVILSGIAASAFALYTLYEVDGVLKITLTSEIKTHLNINSIHQINHLIASNDAIAA